MSQFLDWIDESRINLRFLSINPAPEAIQIIEETLEEDKQIMNLDYLALNPTAINIIKKYVEKRLSNSLTKSLYNSLYNILVQLSYNTAPEAIYLISKVLETNPNEDYICWRGLSGNPTAIDLIKKYPHKIDWHSLCKNPAPAAIDLITKQLKKNPKSKKISWQSLCRNPAALHIIQSNRSKIITDILCMNELCMNTAPEAIHLIKSIMENYPFMVDLKYLSSNTTPEAIEILETNLDKIDWMRLSRNPAAIHLLEANPDKISWKELSANPAIFKQSYEYVLK
jgi:hypothetical protein